MTDIVERLEGYKREAYPSDMELHETAGRAKDEIERLRADNERLRAALLEIADLRYECGDSECGAEHIARKALEAKDG